MMKRLPKVKRLLLRLSDKTLSAIKNKLAAEKKIRSLILLDSLMNMDDWVEESKPLLFNKLFEFEYEKDKDYLLRNEFRVLQNHIENHIVNEEIGKDLEANPNTYNFYLLKALQRVGALDLFQLEYDKVYRQATVESDFFTAGNISRLNFINYAYYLSEKESNIEMAQHLNDLQLTNLNCFYLAAYRSHEINRVLLSTSTMPFAIIDRPVLPKEVIVNFNPHENDYSAYLYLKAKSFIVDNKERITLLKQCLEFLTHHLKGGEIYEDEMKFCYSHLANSLSLEGEYEQAAAIYELFFKLKMEDNDPLRLNAVCEYVSKLIHIDKYAAAIDYLQKNMNDLMSIEKFQVKAQCLRIACYALEGNEAKLFESIPNDLTKFSRAMKVFLRFNIGIQLFLAGDTESAYREINNLYNSLQQQKLQYDIKPILLFFKRFFNIHHSYPKKSTKHQNFINELKREIVDYDKSASPEYKSYLPFIWLKKQMNNL